MPRDLEHFELARWREQLPRRRQGGGGKQERRQNFAEHGRALDRQIDELETRFEARRRLDPGRINPKLIFKLQLKDEFRELSEAEVQTLGLVILGRDETGVLVVFPSDAAVTELRRRIREYAGMVPAGAKYAELDAIDSIQELSRSDRTGARLAAQPLAAGEIAPLDIELWHSGDRAECRRWIAELTVVLRDMDLAVTDDYVGASICVMRARVNEAALARLLDPGIDYIKQVDRRPRPSFEMATLGRIDAAQLEQMLEAPAEDLVSIVVLDSGVATAHPLLRQVVGDTQSAPRVGDADRSGDVDTRTPGHGTAVAGIAAYSDIGACLAGARFVPSARILSGRVTDENNEYHPDYLVERQLEDILTYFLEHYPTAKVINISLGDSDRVYSDTEYQFRFAAAIDELAYRYRDREIVFVVSAGNISLDPAAGEAALRDYPTALHAESARIVDPATAAIALTVGSLSYGEGARFYGEHDERVGRGVAGQRDWPSPFTRCGPGVNGALKPEVVEFGGDVHFDGGRLFNGQHWGIPTTSAEFAPPEGRLFRPIAGTSFAAPKVANLAARLFREFQGASSNLIRCLVASSAQVPSSRPEPFAELDEHDPDVLRTYGYGRPDFDRARWSAENDVLLLAEESIDLDSFALYSLPSLPSEFFSAPGIGRLTVTLAFDPPTRHTRLDSYLGVTMEAHLFRNRTPEQVAEAIRAYTREERERIADQQGVELRRVHLPTRARIEGELPSNVNLTPGVNTRKKGTLQRGSCDVRSQQWQYDGSALVLAVICRREWAPTTITSQRYAAVVSLSHPSESVRLHEHVRAQLRVTQRARVRQ